MDFLNILRKSWRPACGWIVTISLLIQVVIIPFANLCGWTAIEFNPWLTGQLLGIAFGLSLLRNGDKKNARDGFSEQK